MSFTNLGCQNFGLQNPVTVTLNGAGVATAATFNTAQQTATAGNGVTPMPTASATTPTPGASATTPATGATAPTTGRRTGRRHHRLMNPSGA
jgi:hypothetical protein